MRIDNSFIVIKETITIYFSFTRKLYDFVYDTSLDWIFIPIDFLFECYMIFVMNSICMNSK